MVMSQDTSWGGKSLTLQLISVIEKVQNPGRTDYRKRFSLLFYEHAHMINLYLFSSFSVNIETPEYSGRHHRPGQLEIS